MGAETGDTTRSSGNGGWLRVADAASLLGVSANTLRRADVYRGLPCYRSPGGHRRYRRADIDAFLQRRCEMATAAPSPPPQEATLAAADLDGGDLRGVDDLERRLRDLSAVVDANLAVTAEFGSREEVLRTLARRLCDLSGAPECEISAVDGDYLLCLVDYDHGQWDAAWEGTRTPLSEVPVTATPVRTGRPNVVGDIDTADLDASHRESMRSWGYLASLTVPMLIRGEVIGVVELLDSRPREWRLELPIVTSLAQTAAHALDNSRLLRRVERQNAALSELVELGALVSGTHDPRTMARVVAQRVRHITGATFCSVSILEDESIHGLASWGETGLNEAIDGWREPLSVLPATRQAAEDRDVLVVEDPSDPRLGEVERARFARHSYQSEITVPLVVEDRVVGFLDVFSTERRDWSDDADFLRSVGQLAAGALDKALLLDHVERHNVLLSRLVEIGDLATSGDDLRETTGRLCESLKLTLGVDNCEIYSLEDDRLHLLAGFDEGGPAEEWAHWSAPLSEYPTTAAAVAGGQVLVVKDLDDPRLSTYERERMEDFGLLSEICVPLVVEDRVVGIIDIFDVRPRDYAEYVDFLRSVAPILARALENALLVGRLTETTEGLRQLVDAGLEFGASLDLEHVLTSTAKRMAEVAGTTGCDLYRLEAGIVHNVMSVKHGAVNETFVGSTFPVADYYYWEQAIERREPVYAADILSDPQAFEGDRWAAQKWGYRAALDLPLVVQGEVIGLADLFSAEPFEFQRVELLQALSQIAAQAIANASLYQERDRNARRLELVAGQSLELAATLDLGAVIAATARSLRESGGFTDCDVYTIEGNDIVCAISIVDGEEYEGWLGKRLPLEEWPSVRQAVETGLTVSVESLDDPRLGPVELGVRREWDEKSVLIVPLLAKERVVAIVELIDRQRPRHFDGDQLATVEALSRVAALALDNAGLYSDIKQLHVSNLKALSSALNAKDYYTLGHAARVAGYMVLLGKELGWSAEFIERVEEAAYLHDIGKIGVSDRVLLKRGGLNAHEWELMRQHPIFSADIIKPLFDESLALGVRHHHERYDGGGYPDGLAAEAIPEVARVMCVVDSYDAMSFRRPYRQALTFAECLAELRHCSGTQFDPEIVEVFVRVLESLQARKREAIAVAEQAAQRIDADTHARVRDRGDEQSEAYSQVRAVLREVLESNPPTRYLGTRARCEDHFVIVADVGGEGETQSHVGDEVFADDELPEAFEGVRLDAVVLYVDEFGVWVSGLAPVCDAEGTVAAVVAADMPPPHASESEMEGLRSDVTQTFASMLHSAAARLGRAELEAITDGLTGLYNHRYLHERLDEEIERAERQGKALSLLLCDVDHFKEFNETFGHSAGDEMLRMVGRVVEGCIRHVDLAARYGGGEFAVILVETDPDGALEVAERLRAEVAEAGAASRFGALSISIGAASFPRDATTKSQLLDKTDWAMYLAKRQGRDRVLSFRSRQPVEDA